MDVVNASIAIVNEDDSPGRPRRSATRCCRRCSCRPPRSRSATSTATWTPANTPSSSTCRRSSSTTSQRDATPTIQIITDATAMSQAGRGPGYIQNIITSTVEPFWSGARQPRQRAAGPARHARALQSEHAAGLVRRHQPDHQQHLGAGDLPDRRRGAARARARQPRASAGDAAAALRADVRQDLGERAGRRRRGDGLAVPGRQGRDRRADRRLDPAVRARACASICSR